jgi:DNA-binding transcriptional LysR family regulator
LALVEQDVEAGRLQRLLIDYEARGRDFYLLYVRDRVLPAKLRAFVDFALTRFANTRMSGQSAEGVA